MADNITTSSTGAAVSETVMFDEVTDGSLGTAKVQLNKIMDGTVNGTNKMTVDTDGAAKVAQKGCATATKTNVAGATSSTALIASNTSRLGASVFNDSTSALYVNLGSAASTTAFVVKLAAASYYEVPFGYTGAVNGIWDTATGSARVCEFTS